MKKYLFLLLLPFLFIDSVYATECNNLYRDGPGNLTVSGAYLYSSISTSIRSSCNPATKVCLSSSNSYIFYALDSSNNLVNLTPPTLYQFVLTTTTYWGGNTPTYSLNFPPMNSNSIFTISYSQYGITQSDIDYWQSLQFYLIEGTEVCIPTPPEPEPPEPPEPSSGVLSSFITLYLDRISYLANGFISNEYLFSMVVVIFSFIVLELFLHIIHLKGGYKK